MQRDPRNCPSASAVSTPSAAVEHLLSVIKHALPRSSAVSIWFESDRGLEFRSAWGLRFDVQGRLLRSPIVNVVVTRDALEVFDAGDASARRRVDRRVEEFLRSRSAGIDAGASADATPMVEEWMIDRSCLLS